MSEEGKTSTVNPALVLPQSTLEAYWTVIYVWLFQSNFLLCHACKKVFSWVFYWGFYRPDPCSLPPSELYHTHSPIRQTIGGPVYGDQTWGVNTSQPWDSDLMWHPLISHTPMPSNTPGSGDDRKCWKTNDEAAIFVIQWWIYKQFPHFPSAPQLQWSSNTLLSWPQEQDYTISKQVNSNLCRRNLIKSCKKKVWRVQYPVQEFFLDI